METLSDRMRVHLRRDDCNDQIILGKRGDVHKGKSHGDHRSGYFISIMYETGKKFRIELAKALAIGAEITQEGDTEAVVFIPYAKALANAKQIRSIIHARRIKELSVEAKEALVARLHKKPSLAP